MAFKALLHLAWPLFSQASSPLCCSLPPHQSPAVSPDTVALFSACITLPREMLRMALSFRSLLHYQLYKDPLQSSTYSIIFPCMENLPKAYGNSQGSTVPTLRMAAFRFLERLVMSSSPPVPQRCYFSGSGEDPRILHCEKQLNDVV